MESLGSRISLGRVCQLSPTRHMALLGVVPDKVKGKPESKLMFFSPSFVCVHVFVCMSLRAYVYIYIHCDMETFFDSGSLFGLELAK